ncbi:phosphotransferase [Streptomyces sp. JJ36]|uniref:phosphotransferase n=1 Tax=Streptomyces sp. JJ36 TaxID=2736645 RepID=UPI001F3F5964|nr:phosphotransferase [Streptomyces sp. JJ36]
MQQSPTHLPAATVSALLRRYAVAGEPLSCEPLTRGLLNRGYRLETTRGSYFLKHHLDADPADPAPLERRHRAIAGLEELGLPVVPPVADREGRTVAVVDDRCFALHPWIEGRHRHGEELSAAQCRRLGGLLGQVHTRLQQLLPAQGPLPDGTPGHPPDRPGGPERHTGRDDGPGPLPGPRDRWSPVPPRLPTAEPTGLPAGLPAAVAAGAAAAARAGAPLPGAAAPALAVAPAPAAAPLSPLAAAPAESADPEETEELIGELLARVRARGRRRDAFDLLAEHRLLERRRLLHRYADARPPRGAAPAAGWVHGDFHPLNLLYRDTGPHDGSGEPVAIVDWDRLAVQPRAEEAVRGAAIFFLRPDGSLDLRKVRAYARAYRRCARASAGELGAAVHRVWWERLNDFWMLRWRYQLRDGRADPQFPAAAALVVWWSHRYAAVRDAFCD